jgi:hypothetical protein
MSRKPGCKTISPSEVARALAMAKEGKTCADIAAALGRRSRSIRRRLKREGVSVPLGRESKPSRARPTPAQPADDGRAFIRRPTRAQLMAGR